MQCTMGSRGGGRVRAGMAGGGWTWERVRLATGVFSGGGMVGCARGSWVGGQVGSTLRAWSGSERGGEPLKADVSTGVGVCVGLGLPLDVVGSRAEERRGVSTVRTITEGT